MMLYALRRVSGEVERYRQVANRYSRWMCQWPRGSKPELKKASCPATGARTLSFCVLRKSSSPPEGE